MDIQSFRYGDRVRLELDIDPLAAQCLVPKLIMQPLVENALLHGFGHGEGGLIKITARIDRDTLVCEIRDNGKGMPEFAEQSDPPSGQSGYMERMSGIGLRHIRQKIKMYYGPDYGMQLFSKPNEGTTVKLTLPIHRVEE
jgi:sensor histidine kinase YesM